MTYPNTPLVCVVEAALGADLTAAPGTWTWTDISVYVLGEVAITRGRAAESSAVGPSQCQLRLKNVDSRFTTHHPAGAYYPNWRRGVPIRVRINPGTGLVSRFTGFVDEVRPVWPASTWSEVRVSAGGILRRLTQGQALDSALRRTLMHDQYASPVAYWPMEDASGAGSFGSATGGPAMIFSSWQLASDSSIAGSLSLPKAASNANANFFGGVPAYPASPEWAVAWPMRMPDPPTTTTGLMAWNTAGTPIVRWKLELVPNAGTDMLYLRGYNAAGADLVADSGTPFSINGAEPYGKQLFFQAWAAQGGTSGLNYGYNIATADGNIVQYGAKTISGLNLGNVVEVDHSASPGLTAGGYTIGHVAVAANSSYGTFVDEAARGWAGEVTDDRFVRLCSEEHVAVGVDGDTSVGSQMGPQQTATLLTLLRQCEEAEVGLIYERTDGVLMLRTRDERYNRIPTLALDVADGHVLLGFAPTDDDQRLANDWSVSRPGGGTARSSAVDVRDGSYTGSATLNVQYDWMLPNHASWRVHLGTVNELRIPALAINLQSSPDLIGQWLATDIGDWLTVDHLPAQYPPGTASLILEGYTETFDAVSWSAVLNVSPSRPWEVFELDADARGRVDTSGSYLAAGAAAGVTTLTVATTSGQLWTTRPQDVPFDVEISGLRVRVTGIADSVSDGFSRNVSGGWGSADTGQPWTVGAGTAANFSVASGQGKITSPTAVSAEQAVLLDAGSADVSWYVEQTFGGVGASAGGLIRNRILGRATDISNCYIAQLELDSAGTVRLLIQKRVGGAQTNLGSAVVAGTNAANNWWRIALSVIGSGVTATAQNLTAGTLPVSYSVTDSSLTAGTLIGCDSQVLSGNTQVPLTCLYDHLQAANPQTFTVQRNLDGVDKLLPAGSAVSLWRPGVLAL